MLVCGNMSYLVDFRENQEDSFSCNSEKSLDLIILSILGIILTLITSFVIVFFLRSCEFKDQTNLLKRRFRGILVVQLVLRFLLSILYLLDNSDLELGKHIITQILALSLLYDLIVNWPFLDIIIGKFFLAISSVYYYYMTLFTIYTYYEQFKDETLFYLFVIGAVVFLGFFIGIYNYKYEKIMKLETSNFPQMYSYIDFYLEEIKRLLDEQNKDEQCRFKIIETIKFHKKHCKNSICQCRYYSTNTIQDGINYDVIINFIDSYFQWALKQEILYKNPKDYEHIQLKYINYQKILGVNPNKAYLQLKLMLSSQKIRISFFFELISKTLSKNLEEKIEDFYQNVESKNKQNNKQFEFKSKTDLNAENLAQIQQFQQKIIPKISKFVKDKSELYQQMQKGYPTINLFQNRALKFAQHGEKVRQELEDDIQQLGQIHSDNIIYHKIKSLYYCLILKEYTSAWREEKAIQECKKKDLIKDINSYTNINLASGNIISLVVSIAEKKGKILTKLSPKMANFFGYRSNEADTIVHINQVLPNFLASQHNEIIDNMFLRTTESPIIQNIIQNYVMSKQKFIIPVNVYINHIFYNIPEDDFCLNATLLKKADNEDFIIFDQHGFVQGISKKLFNYIFDSSKKSSVSGKSTKFQINSEEPVKFQQKSILQSQKTQKSNKTDKGPKFMEVQELYNSYLVQFFIPQLSQSFFKDIDKKFDYKTKTINSLLFAEQKGRIKLPIFMNQIQQDCLMYLKSGDENGSKSQSKYSLNSGMSKMSKVSQRMYSTQGGRAANKLQKSDNFKIKKSEFQKYFNFFSEDANQKTFEFIKDNRDQYQTSECLCDFSCVMDLNFSNIHYGEKLGKQISYFILKLKDITPAKDIKTNDNNSSQWFAQNNQNTMSYNTYTVKNQLTQKSEMTSNHQFMNSIKSKNQSSTGDFDKDKKPQKETAATQQPSSLIQSQEIVNNLMQSNYEPMQILDVKNVEEKNTIEDKIIIQNQETQNIDTSQNLITNQNNDDTLNLDQSNVHLVQVREENTDRKEIQDKQNKYLQNYELTNNQNQKPGEVSVLPSPDVSMIMEDQNQSRFQTPRPDEQIPNSTNRDSFYPDNQKKVMQIKNQFQPEQAISEKQNEKSDVENLQKSYQEQDLFYEGTNHQKTEENITSKKQKSINSQEEQQKQNTQEQNDVDSEHQINNYNETNILKQNNNNQNTAMSYLSQNEKKNNLNANILKELFHPKSYPQSFQIFQYLIFIFIFCYVVLNVIFVGFFVGKFTTLLEKLELQNYPNLLNRYFQGTLMSGIGLLEVNSEYMKDHQFYNELNHDFEEFYESEKTKYYEIKEQYNEEIIAIENSNFKNNLYSVQIFLEYSESQQLQTPTQIIDLMYTEMKVDLYKYVKKDKQTLQNAKPTGIYTLLINSLKHDKITKEMGQIYSKLADEQGDFIFETYIIFTLVVLLIYIIIFLILLPYVLNILSYQEKILLLVIRIYQYESEIEYQKLNSAQQYLDSTDEEWVNTSFFDITTTTQYNFLKQDPKKQQIIQAKIGSSTKISKIKYVVILLLSCLFIILYFSAIILIVAYLIRQLKPSKQLNADSFTMAADFTSMVTQIELLLTEEILLVIDPSLPHIDRQSYIENLQVNQEFLQEFTQNFQHDLAESSVFSESLKEDILKIYKDDFTQFLTEEDDVMGDDVDLEGISYENGVVGVITYFQQILKEYQDYLQVELRHEEADIPQLAQYLVDPQHIEFFLMAHHQTIPAIQKIISLLYEGNTYVVEMIIQVCNLYFLIFGSFNAIVVIIGTFYILHFFKKRIAELNFLLTVIPGEILQQPATVYLLKNIIKI